MSDKNLLMGVVAAVQPDALLIRKPDKSGTERRIAITPETKYGFVGFQGLGRPADRPTVGFAVKAILSKDDVAKSILFSPDFPPLMEIPNKHQLTAEELFQAADHNRDGKVDYLEYASRIFQSYKHLPDRFKGKLDTNGDDTLNLEEFEAAIELLEWWRLSRRTAEEWVREADKNSDGALDAEETKTVIGSAHGKFDKLFKNLDRDRSGGISSSELEPHLHNAIYGKSKSD